MENKRYGKNSRTYGKEKIPSDYYNKEKDIKNYNGIEYVAYDKEYTDEALDNEEYDKKNDEID